MTVLRWIMTVLAVLFGGGALLLFVGFVANGIDSWLKLARKLRRLFFAVALFWFNVEIWGRVVWTLVHW